MALPTEFYVHFWKLLNKDLTDMANSAVGRGFIFEEVNVGLVKLFPKWQDQLKVGDWRPITILNSSY